MLSGGGVSASFERPTPPLGLANVPLSKGGLGLRSAVHLRFAAHWGSWADCLHMVKARHAISGMMVRALATADRSLSCLFLRAHTS